MQVVALKVGFFGGSLRQPGDVFDVPEDSKAKWFAPATTAASEAAKPKQAPKQQPKALSELSGKAKSFVEVHSEKSDLA